jgi:PleD family two-component response regulator
MAKVQAVLPLRGFRMSQSRVLLADDNPAILEKAASTLASEFFVVAAVHNGQEAWDADVPNWILMSSYWTYRYPFGMGSRLPHV